MKHKSSRRSLRQFNRCVAVFGFSAAALSAGAQPVLVTPPQMPSQSSGADSSTGESSDTEDSGSTLGLASDSSAGAPFRWRKLSFRPRASYQFLYGNGILSSTNREEKTIVQTLTAGLTIGLGEHWLLDYTPSYVIYSDSHFKNALNHSLSLSGRTTYQDWSYGVSFGLGISSNPQTETAQQTDQQTYSAGITVGRQLNGSLSLDSSAGINFRLTDKFNDSKTYNTMHWLNYQWGPNLGLGLGVGGGYEESSLSSDMTYERVLGRIIWHIIKKLDLSLNGGPEFRQFRSDKPGQITPVYGASLAYRPFEPTTLTLSGNRSVGASYFADQVTESTTVSLSLNQRFLRRYFFGVSGGYTFTSYESSSQDSTAREDNSYFYSASLGTSFLKRGSFSVFYSHSENSSDENAFAYDSDQIGFTVGYSY